MKGVGGVVAGNDETRNKNKIATKEGGCRLWLIRRRKTNHASWPSYAAVRLAGQRGTHGVPSPPPSDGREKLASQQSKHPRHISLSKCCAIIFQKTLLPDTYGSALCRKRITKTPTDRRPDRKEGTVPASTKSESSSSHVLLFPQQQRLEPPRRRNLSLHRNVDRQAA